MDAILAERSDSNLTRLGQIVGGYLRGDRTGPVSVDEDLLRFARARHGVGPLLLSMAGQELAGAKFVQAHRALVRRQAMEALQIKIIDACFAEAGIPWLILKGAPQAQMLYGDAALRPSVDIDILVPPGKFTAAFRALQRLGWTAPSSRRFFPQGFALSLLRDVDLYAPGSNAFHIELHQRPLYLESFATTGQDLFDAVVRDPFPAPAIGPALAYYLFAHGAASAWCRLKWLVDFALIQSRLDADGEAALLAKASRLQVEPALAASILLAKDVLAASAETPLVFWAEAMRGTSAVRRCYDLFGAALQSPATARDTPLSDRRLALKTQFLVNGTPSARLRLLVQAPLGALIRTMAGLSHFAAGAGR